MALSYTLPMMDLASKRQRFQNLESSIAQMRCKQQRRRRTGALRPGTSFPAVSSPSVTRPKKSRPKKGPPNRKKIEESSFEDLLINFSESKNAASDGNLTSRTSRTRTDASDVQSVSVEETKARKIHMLKALILDLEKTDNALYEQIVERKKTLDVLYASRRQLKQQQTNIQHSRDEIVDVLEGLRKEERSGLIKVKQAQYYSKVLKCMRDRQVKDLMANKKLYESYDKCSRAYEIEVEDTQQELIEIQADVETEKVKLVKAKQVYEAHIRNYERAVRDAKVVVEEKKKKKIAEELRKAGLEEELRKSKVEDMEQSVLRKMEGKLVVQKTLQMKKHYEVHVDAFRQIWLATGLKSEEQLLERYRNQDAYVGEAQAVVRALQLQVYSMMDSNERNLRSLNEQKYTSSQLESQALNLGRMALDDSLKQEDLVPQSDAWWNLEKQKKMDELAVVKKSAQVSQQSHSRVEQFISTLLRSLGNVDSEAIGQVDDEDKKPPLPKPGKDGSKVTTENIDIIGSNINQLCQWLLSDEVEDLIHRARLDSTVRFNYRLHPLNRRVNKDPPPRREKQNEHYRGEQTHPLENLLFNPLRMPLTETDIDVMETKNMKESVMGRRDVKNMSLARFRICKPLQLKKELAETES